MSCLTGNSYIHVHDRFHSHSKVPYIKTLVTRLYLPVSIYFCRRRLKTSLHGLINSTKQDVTCLPEVEKITISVWVSLYWYKGNYFPFGGLIEA